MDKYEKLHKVGEGGFGKVYKARDKITGQLVAIKRTRLDMDNEGIPATTLREISLLQLLSQSAYVAKMLSVEHEVKNGKPLLYIVMEYLDIDLLKFLKCVPSCVSDGYLPPNIVKSFMFQLCKGVADFHSHGVMHRDLKPENLLVDTSKGLLKIADLGCGRAFTPSVRNYTTGIGTLLYSAPEILLGSADYSTPVDIWSVGCIFAPRIFPSLLSQRHGIDIQNLVLLAEMVITQSLFRGVSEITQLLDIFRLLGTPTEEMWPGVKSMRYWHEYPQWKPFGIASKVPNLCPSGLDLLSKMLQYNPANRISAKKALSHPYFDDLDKSRF